MPASEAAKRYGVAPKRVGQNQIALCCFHNERTPSLTFFRDGRFRCFGCGASGDSIAFTSLLFHENAAEALRRLNQDFSLHLPIDERLPKDEWLRQQRERERRQAAKAELENWRDNTISKLCACHRIGHEILKSGKAELNESEAFAVLWMHTAEYFSLCLSNGDEATVKSLYQRKETIEELCNRILKLSPMK